MRNGWQTTRLSEVLEKTETVNPLDFPNTEFAYIDVSSISNTTFEIAATQCLKGKDAPSRARKLVRANDVLFATIRPTLRRIAVVPDMLDRQVCSTGYFVLRTKQGIDHRFIFYWLFTEDFLGQMESLQKGASYPAVTDGDVRSQEISFPPLPEQQRIVALLDEAFAGLATAKANAERNLQNARAIFESHLQAVFSQRGEGWLETTLDRISTNLDSKRVPITKNVRSSGEYPYYGASGIVDYVADYIFEGDNLLVSEDGANLLARSTPIAFSVSGKYWVNNHAHILHFENMATRRFVEFYLQSIKLDEYVTGAAQPKLNQKALNSIPVPIPSSLEMQAQIVESVETLQKETQHLTRLYERKLAALGELKKSLLHQAFNGEL
ncbi:MAG: restriction endonuclease subunit S [Synechococcaceae cyanobacterium ELA445]